MTREVSPPSQLSVAPEATLPPARYNPHALVALPSEAVSGLEDVIATKHGFEYHLGLDPCPSCFADATLTVFRGQAGMFWNTAAR